MKRVIAFFLLFSRICLLHGQVVDSLQYAPAQVEIPDYSGQGDRLTKIGAFMVIGGVAAAGLAVGGIALGNKLDNSSELVVAAYVLGAGFAFQAPFALACGSVFLLEGTSRSSCDVHWADARFLNPGQRGFGLFVEGAGMVRSIWDQTLRLRTVAGYHFNQHFFLGSGIAPGIRRVRQSDGAVFLPSLPVVLDTRICFNSRISSPYIGLSLGAELFSQKNQFAFLPDLYLSAEAGVRFRYSRSKPVSRWLSVYAEADGLKNSLGLKYGRSF